MRKGAIRGASVLAILGLLLAAVGVAAAQPPPPAGPVLSVPVGDGEGPITVNEFFPPTITIAQGTTVSWSVRSDEPHTVTFLAGSPPPEFLVFDPPGIPPAFNPRWYFPEIPPSPYMGNAYANSGFSVKGQPPFSLTFGAQGSFDYVCYLHPEMTGRVNVVAAGTAGITTQAQVDEYAQTHTPSVHGPEIAMLYQTRNVPVRSDGPNGTSIWYVRAGTRVHGGVVEINSFFPDNSSVQAGDTIVWYNDNQPTPHTVTFPAEGREPPELIVPTLPDGTPLPPPPADAPPGPPDFSGGPPRLTLGPATAEMRPAPSYDGRSLFNSGLIGDQDPSRGAAWALTFDVPGVYRYLCVFHPGMEGTINVIPR